MRQVRRIQAETVPEALARVRAELGPEAVIMQTRWVRYGGVLGLFGRRIVEVTATGNMAERKPPAAQDRTSAAQERPLVAARALAAPGGGVAPLAVPGPPPPDAAEPPAAPEPPAELAAVRRELARMAAAFDRLAAVQEQPARLGRMDPAVQDVYRCLAGAGVEVDLNLSLAARLQRRVSRGAPADGVRHLAQQLMARDLGTPCPIVLSSGQRRVVTLVGPTGVGKTTTLAKLAARSALAERWRVGLITMDTYRIAAVEQLRTYCEIIGVELQVLHDPRDAAAALQRLRDHHLVLVDTAGRNHRNGEQMQELGEYLQALAPDDIFLVLALNSGARDALAVALAYEQLGYNRLLLTKLDESASPGLAYSLALRIGKPLTYITTGQNVPDDIEEVRPEHLSRLLLDGAS